MSRLSGVTEDLVERYNNGENPYKAAAFEKILCRINIDPAAAANFCANIGQLFYMLSRNDHNQSATQAFMAPTPDQS